MQKTPTNPGRGIVYAGLTIALLLGLLGFFVLKWSKTNYRGPLKVLDLAAARHFNEAERNVPVVVDELCSGSNFIKLCWLMTGDKISGTHKTQAYLESVIDSRIVAPCRRGAKVYGCDVDSKAFREALREVSRDTAVSAAFATGSLALEAVFIRSTLASMRVVLGAVIGRLAKSYGGGAACAVADGPLPIGDIIGAALAIGGTICSISDLQEAKRQFPRDISDVLYQSIRDCRNACRKVASQ